MGVVDDDRVLAELAEPTPRSHVGVLPRLVDAVLARAGLGWADLDGLAVSIGPGSFTGLRIGLGFAKGVAYAGKLPIAAVPTLEALAAGVDAAPGTTIWAVLDARMREVYAASFTRTTDGLARRTSDEALAPDAMAARLDASCVLVGDAVDAYPVLGTAGPRVLRLDTHPPRGGVVARLGAARLRRGEAADVGSLEPAYVRASQAELAQQRPSR